MKTLLSIVTILMLSLSVNAKTFSQVLSEISQTLDTEGVDLSQADRSVEHYFYNYIQFREGDDQPWKDWKRPEEYSRLVENLVGIDLYWSNHVPRDNDKPLVVMESFYLTAFRVVGRELTFHPIMMRMSWPKGELPGEFDMPVLWHKEITLESKQRVEYNYKIGSREFRIYLGYIAYDGE